MNDWFLHNWLESAELETAWSTDIAMSAVTLAEDRRALLGKPHRTITLRWTGLTLDTLNRFVLFQSRLATGRQYVPLYQDQSRVTSAASGQPVITADMATRRFYVGQKALILQRGLHGIPIRYEQVTISAVVSGSLTCVGNLTNTYTADSIVVPLLYCEQILSADIDLITDWIGEVKLTLHEVEEGGALPPSTTVAGTAISGAQTAAEGVLASPAPSTYMILTPDPTWDSPFKRRVVRQGSINQQGRAQVLTALGPRAAFEFELPFLFPTRTEFYFMLRFFDSVRGRLIPFWVISPNAMWQLVSFPSTTTVDVVLSGALADLTEYVQFLAVVLNDGTRYVRFVTGWTLVGGNYRATLRNALPALAVANVQRVTHAVLCRMSDDAMREEWITADVSKVVINTHEVIDEVSVGVTPPAGDNTTNGLRLNPTTDTSAPECAGLNLYLVSAPTGSWDIALKVGSDWLTKTVDSLSPPYLVASALTDGSLYDVFAYWDSGAVLLDYVEWADSTFQGPAARGYTLVQDGGNWVDPSDHTRRYLGTVQITGIQFIDQRHQRYVWNVDNQVLRSWKIADDVGHWDDVFNFWQSYRGKTGGSTQYFINGLAAEITCTLDAYIGTPYTVGGRIGSAIDDSSSTPPSFTASSGAGPIQNVLIATIDPGNHAARPRESNTGGFADSQRFQGSEQSGRGFTVSMRC